MVGTDHPEGTADTLMHNTNATDKTFDRLQARASYTIQKTGATAFEIWINPQHLPRARIGIASSQTDANWRIMIYLRLRMSAHNMGLKI